ncbi:MAG: hypothetical protein JO261_04790 [Alphaproteobacteria bacterium]|nr:hypothetical protein [Alphaproteobacteria bacterium]
MLILHIGTHKTGTSALQAFLASQSQRLCGLSIRYVQAGREGRKAHHPLGWGIRGRRGYKPDVWEPLRRELKSDTTPVKLISSEGLWFTDPAAVREQLGDTPVDRVVLYLRRQDKYLQSLYKQTVAGGREMAFDEWREEFHFRGNYLSVVSKWASVFGKDAIVIRPYERSGRTIDVVEDFLGVLGIDIKQVFPKRRMGRNNPSPRRELLELFRAFNHLKTGVDKDKFFHAVILRNDAYARSADLLDYEACRELLDSFADSNRALVRAFYSDSEPLFPELKPFDPPEIWRPGSEPYTKMLVDMLHTVWCAAQAPNDIGSWKRALPNRSKTRDPDDRE